MKYFPVVLLILAAGYLAYWLIGLRICDERNPKFIAFARCLDSLRVDGATVTAALIVMVLAIAWLVVKR